jgi:hypothetical protein
MILFETMVYGYSIPKNLRCMVNGKYCLHYLQVCMILYHLNRRNQTITNMFTCKSAANFVNIHELSSDEKLAL